MSRKGHTPQIYATLTVLLLTACASQGPLPPPLDPQPFGGPKAVAFAGDLWQALAAARLVGPEAIQSRPYSGLPPHQGTLHYLDRPLNVSGVEAPVITLQRQNGADKTVWVMFRFPGYDAANNDWFWAQYGPDGTLTENAQNVALAGKIDACIVCHKAAPADDRVFSHNRLLVR